MGHRLIIWVILLVAVGLACGGGSPAPTTKTATPTTAPATAPASDSSALTPALPATPSPAPTINSALRSVPPSATLEIGGIEQVSGQGSYCWQDERGAPLCLDMIGIPTAQEPLAARSPFTARFYLSITQPLTYSRLTVHPVILGEQLDSEARGWRWWRPNFDERNEYTLTPEGAKFIQLSLEPGLYVLSLFVRVQGMGDASYGFLVEVQ